MLVWYYKVMTEIHYDDNGYIMLGGIELPKLPGSINVAGHELVKKNEFHITLVGAKALAQLPQDVDASQLMKDAVLEFASQNDLADYEILDEYRLVERGERVTVAAMAQVACMDALYIFLNDKFGLTLPTQPAHVTIYSLDPSVGISINSAEQLANETRIITLPGLDSQRQTPRV